eukprot:4909787-Prymnesium_polylepis.1
MPAAATKSPARGSGCGCRGGGGRIVAATGGGGGGQKVPACRSGWGPCDVGRVTGSVCIIADGSRRLGPRSPRAPRQPQSKTDGRSAESADISSAEWQTSATRGHQCDGVPTQPAQKPEPAAITTSRSCSSSTHAGMTAAATIASGSAQQ